MQFKLELSGWETAVRTDFVGPEMTQVEFQKLTDQLARASVEKLLKNDPSRVPHWFEIYDEIVSLLQTKGFERTEPITSTYQDQFLRNSGLRTEEKRQQQRILGKKLLDEILKRTKVIAAKEKQELNKSRKDTLQRTYQFVVEEATCINCRKAITKLIRPVSEEDKNEWYQHDWIHDETYRCECSSAEPIPDTKTKQSRSYRKTEWVGGKFVRIDSRKV